MQHTFSIIAPIENAWGGSNYGGVRVRVRDLGLG